MSDEGSTGGDVFQISAGGGSVSDLTSGMSSSASNITWPRKSQQLYFTEHYDGGSAISQLDPATGKKRRLWQGDESINPPFDDSGISMTSDGQVVCPHPPLVQTATGNLGWPDWRVEAGDTAKPAAQAAVGRSQEPALDQRRFPHPGLAALSRATFDPNRKYPLVVAVHGGPASSLKPSWPSPGFNPALLSQQGYFVLMPNPRGSYGQGEKFTRANVRISAAAICGTSWPAWTKPSATAPIDAQRIGLTGWSYGGFMTMFAVTQTNRFRAAVAGAGIANWQSYYGQNSIDTWMIPYFGASVYDDPAVYAKMSAIEFIKQVKTPTLVVVGERDGECPAPQSYEFWRALKTLGVKTRDGGLPQRRSRVPHPSAPKGRAAAHDPLVQRKSEVGRESHWRVQTV